MVIFIASTSSLRIPKKCVQKSPRWKSWENGKRAKQNKNKKYVRIYCERSRECNAEGEV